MKPSSMIDMDKSIDGLEDVIREVENNSQLNISRSNTISISNLLLEVAKAQVVILTTLREIGQKV